jgi:hypothetical protein
VEQGSADRDAKRGGACNQLEAAQWLRQQGAEWPDELSSYAVKWSCDAVAWARAEGCDAPI